jgi:hypothetical protein
MKRLTLMAVALLFFATGVSFAQSQPIPMQGCKLAGSCAFGGSQISTVTVTWGAAATSRFLMIFDTTAGAAPSNGASPPLCAANPQANPCLLFCNAAIDSTTAPGFIGEDWTTHPVQGRHGIVAAMSTGADCSTFTQDGNNDSFFAQVK